MLFPLRRILACTDLGPESDEVLRSAELIRKRVGGELDVLHISEFSLFDNQHELAAQIDGQLDRTGVVARKWITSGPIAQKILETVHRKENRYDLLIIGHSNKRGILKQLMGGVARKIITLVEVPTLVVRRPLQFHKIAGYINDSGSTHLMITSILDFYRKLGFQEAEFVSLWHNLPELVLDRNEMKDFEDDLLDDIHSYSCEDDLISVRVEEAREFEAATQLAQIINQDHISMAVIKRSRGQRINQIIQGHECVHMLNLETSNLMVMPS